MWLYCTKPPAGTLGVQRRAQACTLTDAPLLIDWTATFKDFVIVAVGAGAGTWAAFQLERDHRRRERRDHDVVAGNLALVVLAQMYNRVLDLQRQLVNPMRDSDLRWASQPVPIERDEALRFDTPSLAFLLSGAYPSVVSDLELFQRHFRYAEMVAAQRTQLCEKLLQPAIQGVDEGYMGLTGPSDVIALLPGSVLGTMKSITNEMIGAVDTAVAAGVDLYGKLRIALQDFYPTASFIPLEFDEAVQRDEGAAGPAVTP